MCSVAVVADAGGAAVLNDLGGELAHRSKKRTALACSLVPRHAQPFTEAAKELKIKALNESKPAVPPSSLQLATCLQF